jgi:cardiolipin synthase
MYTTFLLALAAARRSILVTNPYFILDEKMTEALLAAVARGVRVQVLVPGAIDHNLVRQASRRQFGELLRAGVEIFEYRAALLHAKTMIIDSVWATVGSTNLDNRSLAINQELNLIVYNEAFARRLEQVFIEDLAYSAPVTYRDWQKRGVVNKLLEVIAFPVRDLL